MVPFISSITVYFLTPTIPPSRGFSDIVFSVVGLFPAATLIFMKSRSGFVYAIGWLLLVIIAYFFFTSQLTDAVVLFVIYALLFSLWGLKMKFFNKELFAKQVGILYVLIISPVILLLLGFPVILTVNGSLVNVMVHYTGLQFGILVGFFYLYRDYFNRVFSSITSLFKSKKWTE